MRVRLITFAVFCVFILSLSGMALAEEATYTYIGAKKCSMCHKKDGTGPSWKETAHATAFDKLTDEQKKDEAILPFYTTGTDKKGVLLEGVQCEACHGPGSAYKKKAIMEDQEQAIANGLLIPDEKTCMKCHNAEAPTEALKASAKGFDYAKLKAKGVHAMPEKAKKAKKTE